MNTQLHHDLENLDNLLDVVKKQGLYFLNQVDERHTSNQSTVDLDEKLSETGLGGLQTLAHFNEKFEPMMVASTGPRYWGFVTGGSTPASIMGDWLATIYDQNTQTVKGQGDNSAIIEVETINLLLDLFGLPDDFIGGFVSGATMSNFTCLGVARQWLGKELGKDFAKEGITQKINILSATPHSSAIKSLAMLGIGSNNLTQVATLPGSREAMDVEDLEKKIVALDDEPFILISSAGTVNTSDFDDFRAIARLKEKHNFWWHIDAAFGGFAACSPRYKPLVEGWGSADSITMDNHKWMNVPYESAFYLIKRKHQFSQVETFQNSNAPYLGDPLENFNYLNFLPENSRRLKALPVWFSIKAYGKKGYQDIVENSVTMAQLLGQMISESEKLELLAPVRLNNVCFSLSGDENQEKVAGFLTKLNQTGKVFMTPTQFQGKKGIRASFVNWRTTKEDVELVMSEIDKI
ncbi:pyridoxal-dependent decarboxylase [Reichenbachiella agarivorans]|uniref:Pyridoxal-dependent decarboxylase n=1 Tax=Reichenbachiella agarivorans TaxID=2979464 RepID=A0ABY6CS88_9BACT|nr:pyridoxal-dependent decarboxylase [Reichenbachiella agarivorans]UXP33348.1 pyridoxal-dependent decarboxylase [Reichenbachiella agarivorans]